MSDNTINNIINKIGDFSIAADLNMTSEEAIFFGKFLKSLGEIVEQKGLEVAGSVGDLIAAEDISNVDTARKLHDLSSKLQFMMNSRLLQHNQQNGIGSQAIVKPEPKPERKLVEILPPKSEPKPERKLVEVLQPKSDLIEAQEPKSIPEAKPEPVPVSEPKSTPEAKPEPTPVSEPKSTPEAKPEPTPVSEPKSTPEAITTPAPKPVPAFPAEQLTKILAKYDTAYTKAGQLKECLTNLKNIYGDRDQVKAKAEEMLDSIEKAFEAFQKLLTYLEESESSIDEYYREAYQDLSQASNDLNELNLLDGIFVMWEHGFLETKMKAAYFDDADSIVNLFIANTEKLQRKLIALQSVIAEPKPSALDDSSTGNPLGHVNAELEVVTNANPIRVAEPVVVATDLSKKSEIQNKDLALLKDSIDQFVTESKVWFEEADNLHRLMKQSLYHGKGSQRLNKALYENRAKSALALFQNGFRVAKLNAALSLWVKSAKCEGLKESTKVDAQLKSILTMAYLANDKGKNVNVDVLGAIGAKRKLKPSDARFLLSTLETLREGYKDLEMDAFRAENAIKALDKELANGTASLKFPDGVIAKVETHKQEQAPEHIQFGANKAKSSKATSKGVNNKTSNKTNEGNNLPKFPSYLTMPYYDRMIEDLVKLGATVEIEQAKWLDLKTTSFEGFLQYAVEESSFKPGPNPSPKPEVTAKIINSVRGKMKQVILSSLEARNISKSKALELEVAKEVLKTLDNVLIQTVAKIQDYYEGYQLSADVSEQVLKAFAKAALIISLIENGVLSFNKDAEKIAFVQIKKTPPKKQQEKISVGDMPIDEGILGSIERSLVKENALAALNSVYQNLGDQQKVDKDAFDKFLREFTTFMALYHTVLKNEAKISVNFDGEDNVLEQVALRKVRDAVVDTASTYGYSMVNNDLSSAMGTKKNILQPLMGNDEAKIDKYIATMISNLRNINRLAAFPTIREDLA